MQLKERELGPYFTDWLLNLIKDGSRISNYDLIDKAFRKTFDRERDCPIDEAEDRLYTHFDGLFDKRDWDKKEADRKAAELKKEQEAEKRAKQKEVFHENLWTLPVIMSRLIKMVRQKEDEENAWRIVPKQSFHVGDKWLILKRFAMNLFGERCMSCGLSQGFSKGNDEIQVDHVLPQSKYPDLAYDLDNLQILCKKCNHEKRDFTEADYRDENDMKLIDTAYRISWDDVLKIYNRGLKDKDNDSNGVDSD